MRFIGAGPYGIVILAEDIKSKELRAIKYIYESNSEVR